MKARDILNNHSLKRTSCREGIVEIMLNAKKALSEIEIRNGLSANYDRTTFYRSFRTLEEHSIIHRIVLDNQTVKYAINCSANRNKEHAHFYCSKCHTVQCIDAVENIQIKLPANYTIAETNVLIKGICANCKKDN